MGWASGTYTKGNAATGGWTGDATNGIGIEASRHDTQDDDFTTGINACLAKDGSNQMGGNLNFNGNLPTNVGSGTAAAPAYCAGNDVDTGMFSPGANTLALSTGGTERLRLNSTGQQLSGITTARTNLFAGGVTSIEQREHVISGTTRSTSQIWNDASANGGYITIGKTRGATTGSNTIVQSGDQLGGISFQGADGTNMIEAARIQGFCGGTPGVNDMPGTLVFSTTADGAAAVSERMRIDSAGKIGMGTTVPAVELDVQGASTAQFRIKDSSVDTRVVASTPSNVGIVGTYSSHDFAIVTNGTVRMRTNTSGRSQFSTGASDSTVYPVSISKTDNVATAGSNYFVEFLINAGATASGRIATNGANAAAFFSTSDRSVKENIVDLEPQLPKILALRPVEFDYINNGGHQIGFVAQEVEEIYPDNVYMDPDGIRSLGDMSRMDARIIKAIQDLNAKVESLEAKIVALENA